MQLKQPCPCNSGATYLNCCYKIIVNPKNASTALQLMRSRYSAYSLNIPKHILKTMSGKARDNSNAQSIKEFAKKSKLIKLEIIATKDGNIEDNSGTVEFQATGLNHAGEPFKIHETSLFKKISGKWFYCDEIKSDDNPK